MNKLYLGDGLYAEYDGHMLVLKANDDIHPSDIVYLDPSTLSALVLFLKKNGVIE